jgi:arabinan endo-1,5-alpha-L-arabinosidase
MSQAEPEVLTLEGDISPIHDPTMIREGDTYYVFATNRFQGQHVPQFCSKDLRHWKFCGHVFEEVPHWALRYVPGARGMWAPDVSYVNGRYRIYYSVSTFGSTQSVIGLITNKTLDPENPDYRWVDEGYVVASSAFNDWNSIDADFTEDENGGHWLVWGSFWGGIKLHKLDQQTGKLSSEDTTMYSLASRRPLQPPAIEAPVIVRRGGFYYLFVSFDRCCRGAESTYKIMVGRSRKIIGPYAGRDGKPMMEGGGTLLMEGSERWRGPGGQHVLLQPEGDLLVFHAYDAKTGRPSLHISRLVWDEEGWPKAGKLPAE